MTLRLRLACFCAVVLTALALVPVGAHLSALPTKLGLPQERYFIVQGIYRGWALFGLVLFGVLTANLTLAVMLRRRRAPFWLALAAFVLVAGTLAVFFAWTYPANRATSDWTVAPDNWRELRAQWECSYAVDAVLTFGALGSVTLPALLARD